MVSAFGATDFPTSAGKDPVAVAKDLAAFVKANNFDGADVDWEDNDAMNKGIGEAWVIAFTRTLRAELPAPYIITHAPQGPYFMGTSNYVNNGYLAIHAAVPHHNLARTLTQTRWATSSTGTMCSGTTR